MESTKKDLLKSLGSSIRFYRELAGFSQEDLANRAGYTTANARSTISKIESGSSDIPASKLRQIASALDVSLSDLVSGPPAQKVSSGKHLIEVNNEEQSIIHRYRVVDDSTKTAVCAVLGVERQEGEGLYGLEIDA